MFEERFTHAFAQLGLSVHDISVSALAAAVITLGVVLMMELRCVLRMRQVVDNQLGRVFEQLDLLRFETQQLLEGQQSIESRDATRVSVAAMATATVASGRQDPIAAPPGAHLPRTGPAAANAAPAFAPVAPVAALKAVTAESVRPSGRDITAGEARLLSSLAQARSRRVERVSA
jgi:hypothetical protein